MNKDKLKIFKNSLLRWINKLQMDFSNMDHIQATIDQIENKMMKDKVTSQPVTATQLIEIARKLLLIGSLVRMLKIIIVMVLDKTDDRCLSIINKKIRYMLMNR